MRLEKEIERKIENLRLGDCEIRRLGDIEI